MPVIDNKPYKLDIYDNNVSRVICNCDKDEKNCKKAIKKLVLYNRDEIHDMHSKAIMDSKEYDVSKLKPISFLEKNEEVVKVVPLDKFWIGAFIADKKTGEIKKDKVMYISISGEGYMTDEFEPAIKGYVPECVYLQYIYDTPSGYCNLDEKYFDGNHKEFLKNIYAKARGRITNILTSIIKDEKFLILNTEFKNKEPLTLEDIAQAIKNEYRKKEKGEDFDSYKVLDMLFASFGGDILFSLEKKHCENRKESEPGDE